MAQTINNLSQTWNAGGTTYSAIKFNVTDTASAADSTLIDLQVGGSSKFKVGKAGTITTPSIAVDSSGNLGLGVTPSATASQYRSIELFGAYWMGGNGTTPASYSYTNAYFDGADRYKVTGFAASMYRQLNGAHSWYTAPSGTAGNAITFTQAMTLDASGNFIHQVNGTAPTLSTNGTMSFELTSNTSLKIVVRGSDGVTRSVSLTLA